MQDEGLYVAIQYIIYQKQISRNKGAKKKATTKKKKKKIKNKVTLKAS